MKNLTIALLLAITTCSVAAQTIMKTSSQEVTVDQVPKREALKKDVISSYMEIKNKLIVSDSLQASKAAAKLAAALTQFKFKKLTLEEMNAATTIREKLKDLATSIAGTHVINKQRNYFMELSEEMWVLIERFVPEKTTLYEQKCPMTGKVWISEVKEIKNPYFPKNMLTCGEVTASVGTSKI